MSVRALLAFAAPTALALGAACGRGDQHSPADAPVARADGRGAAVAHPAGNATRYGRYGLGHPADARRVAALDTDVDTTGAGLPPGRGAYTEGAAVYARKCAACHGARGEGVGRYPKLVQPARRFDRSPFGADPGVPKTVGNYWPYATTLYDYVHHAMPPTAPGSLTASETYALVAYLLAENGVVGRSAVMDATTLPAVRMPARGRFVLDDRRGGPEVR